MTNKTPIGQITHPDKRLNIPSAELEPVLDERDKAPIRVAYDRRNPDLDPQLIWRGKDPAETGFTVDAPPIYLQEQVHPKAIIEDLRAGLGRKAGEDPGPDLFAHFGLDPGDREAEVEFYRHARRWSNRMILGDALQVMASLSAREGLKGQVQAIYIDPPYGIRFNSKFQWSTTSRDVKDGNLDHLTREPEQVKAFRDTWRDGIHSYLTYLRDRLVVARDLLTDSGSCFVQIGDENVHRVRALMDEVFGEGNFVSLISFKKTSGTGSAFLDNIYDQILWYARSASDLKFRRPFQIKSDYLLDTQYRGSDQDRLQFGLGNPAYMSGDLSSQGASEMGTYPIALLGQEFKLPPNTHWKASRAGMPRLTKASRLDGIGRRIRYKRYADDFPVVGFNNTWDDTIISGYADPKVYVVQTSPKVVQR